jgi:PAS domain S-box-containing protein
MASVKLISEHCQFNQFCRLYLFRYLPTIPMPLKDTHQAWSEDDRVSVLHHYGILDTPAEQDFDDIVAMVSQLLEVPIAAVNLIDRNRQWFKSEVGLGVQEMPLDNSICKFALLEASAMVVPDTRQDPRFASNPLVTGAPGLQFYAGELLQTPEGIPLGTLCALDFTARPEGLSSQQAFYLKTLAKQVMNQILLRKTIREQEDAVRLAHDERHRLDAVLEAVPVAIRYVDSSGRTNIANAENERLWGPHGAASDIAHASGLKAGQSMQPQDSPLARALAGERVTGDLIEIAAGRKRVLSRASPVKDESGNIVGAVVADTDITNETHMRLALDASEATLAAVLDALPVGVIIADAKGQIVRDNAANRDIWGIAPRSASWEEYGEWEGYWPASGRRIAPDEWAMSRALLQGTTTHGELVECQPFDGGPRRFFLNSAAPIRDAHGKIVGGVVAALDVTEQRQAEAALARSNELAHAAAERVNLALAADAIVGTWDWDLVSDRFTVDERFAEKFGIDPALGQSGLSLEQVIATVHPDDLDGLMSAIDAAISRGGPYSHEYRVRDRNGVYHWIEANGRVDLSSDGTPLRFPGVLLDIERRRTIEAERDRAVQLLRAFVDALPGIAYAKDRSGRMVIANRGVSELVGKPPEFYLGKTDMEFLDSPAQARAVMDNDRRIMESGLAQAVEEDVSFPDGSLATWLSTKAPFHDLDGEVIGLIGSSIDITSRKLAEAALEERTDELAEAQLRLEVAMTAAQMGTWEWSPATGEAYWSPQMFQMLGLPRTEDGRIDGREFFAKVHPDDHAGVEAALAEAVDRKGRYEAEMRILLDDGQVRWLMGRGVVLRGTAEQELRLVGVNVDITQRKKAEQLLLDADSRRNEFLAMLGHELRNPLAPITHAAQLIELGVGGPERTKAALRIIRRQTEQMSRLVDDLLEVSRVTQGRIDLRKEHLRIGTPLQAAVEAVRPLVREREQGLDVDIAPEIDILADQARLTQIVANLLNNASKYTQTGGQIRLKASATGDRQEWVEIVVSDNGPGIDADLLPRIFDLFSQGTTTLDRSRGGLGIGLSLVKRLVELHGGRIRATSPGAGMGATFTVCLPREDLPAHAPPPTQEPRSQDCAPRCILVVDDNPDVLDTLVSLLTLDGHQLASARDGEEALRVARQLAPDVVILDVGLPKMDGWEVARALRADPATKGAVLIALSGYGQRSDRERSREAGFDEHLLKPADVSAIYRAVNARRSLER